MSLVWDQGTAPKRFGPGADRVERVRPRKGRRVRRLWVPAAGLLLLGCAPPAPAEPGLRIRIAPTPPSVGTARIVVQVVGDTTRPVSGSVSGRPLPDGAQGPLAPAVESGPSALSVPAFDFHTPGSWRLVAQVTLTDGTVVRDSTDVHVVEALSRPPDPPEG